MNLARADRQRPRPVEHLDLAWEIVVGPEIAVELRPVALLDDQQARLACESRREALWSRR